MPPSIPAARLRQFIAFYVAFIAVVTVLFALINARAAHPWVMGEWLINYSAGFVRRGLPGEAVLLAHRVSGLPLLGLASGLQITVYALFYLSLIPLLRGLRWSLPLLLLLLSPATLAFTALDPPSSVRKEALLFLALSASANALLFLRPRAASLAAAFALIAPALILTHEALFAFLPWLAVPLLVCEPRGKRALSLALVPALLCAAAFGCVLLSPGNTEQVTTICSSIGGSFLPSPGGLCTGAIAYMEFTPAQAHADAMRAMHFYHHGSRYGLPLLLTIWPAVLLLRDRLRRPEDRRSTVILLACGAVSIAASLPLFWFARDWGRWIEIHATCLLLLMLLLERRCAAGTPVVFPAPAKTGPASEEDCALVLPISPGTRAASLLALVLYSTCWTLPAVGIFPGRFGYFDLARYLLTYRSKPHLGSSRVPRDAGAVRQGRDAP